MKEFFFGHKGNPPRKTEYEKNWVDDMHMVGYQNQRPGQWHVFPSLDLPGETDIEQWSEEGQDHPLREGQVFTARVHILSTTCSRLSFSVSIIMASSAGFSGEIVLLMSSASRFFRSARTVSRLEFIPRFNSSR
jgi:hypothetical protein